MDADVIWQPFLSGKRPGMQETAHLLGPHVICATRFPDVSEIFSGERSSISRANLIKFWPFNRIYPGALSLVTHLTDMVANLIPCVTTIETELLDKK